MNAPAVRETMRQSIVSKWIIDKEATETEKGSKHEECEVCGYKKAAIEIPATGGGTIEPSEPTKPVEPTEPTEPDDPSKPTTRSGAADR